MNRPIRILIADDHPLFRGGLRALLESVPDTEVVGEAATGEEAVELALGTHARCRRHGHQHAGPQRHRCDSSNPRRDRIEVNVLVMTMHDDDEAVFAAIRAGARGYLLKGAAQDETLRAIRSVANGEAIFGPGVATGSAASWPRRGRSDPSQAFPQLTDRELEILQFLAERRTNAEIAAKLFLSQKTVRNYVSAIFAKLQVADRAEAGLVARTAGLGGQSPVEE